MQISTFCRTLLLPIDFAKRVSFVCLVVVIPVVVMMGLVVVVVSGHRGGWRGKGWGRGYRNTFLKLRNKGFKINE
jgi:hypothetical protein